MQVPPEGYRGDWDSYAANGAKLDAALLTLYCIENFNAGGDFEERAARARSSAISAAVTAVIKAYEDAIQNATAPERKRSRRS